MIGNQVAAPFSWTGPYAGFSAGSARTKTRERLTLYDIAKEWQNSDECAGFPEGVTMIPGKDGTPGPLYCEHLLDEWQQEGWIEANSDYLHDVTVLGYPSEGAIKKTHSTLGIFAGYRHQWSNNVVGGVEASYIHSSDYDAARIMGQAGYAFGRVLPYLSLGYDFEEKGAAYGVGIDAALTNRLIGGLVYSKSEDTDRIEARLGWKF